MKDTIDETIVNLDDFNGHFWKHDYRVLLGVFGNSYIVNADHEQDALDYVMDYCEENAPGFVMSRDEEEELEYPEEYIRAGNHCRLFSCDSHEIHIETIR